MFILLGYMFCVDLKIVNTLNFFCHEGNVIRMDTYYISKLLCVLNYLTSISIFISCVL